MLNTISTYNMVGIFNAKYINILYGTKKHKLFKPILKAMFIIYLQEVYA